MLYFDLINSPWSCYIYNIKLASFTWWWISILFLCPLQHMTILLNLVFNKLIKIKIYSSSLNIWALRNWRRWACWKMCLKSSFIKFKFLKSCHVFQPKITVVHFERISPFAACSLDNTHDNLMSRLTIPQAPKANSLFYFTRQLKWT